MSNASKARFVQQQGFSKPDPPACGRQFSSLMFQPRVIGLVVAVGLATQSAILFLALSAALWLGALAPRWNPFDALYNALVARPRGLPPLGPAPPPRRFSQGMSATFTLVIGLALLAGLSTAAWIVEGILVVALAFLLFGRFCPGSYLYHLIRGNREFAKQTLPWARG